MLWFSKPNGVEPECSFLSFKKPVKAGRDLASCSSPAEEPSGEGPSRKIKGQAGCV